MAKASSIFVSILLFCCWITVSNAKTPVYLNPNQPVHKRIEDLLRRMTLEEKIGQMTQIDRSVATPEVMNKYFIGSVLSGGGSVPAKNASARTWIDMVNDFQKASLSTRLKIPMLYGIDAVHGHNNVYNATIFPHNIGLGATRQIMVPYNYTEFIDGLTSLVKRRVIDLSRIDDAVRRILRVKFVMGLFENPLANYSKIKHLGSQEHRELAREAVRKSLVLLKNGKTVKEKLLPLPKKAPKILVAGTHANNIGNQCGGWTITWQGLSGDITAGTTILKAIENTVDPNTEVVYSENPKTDFLKSNEFSFAIVVVGEPPYAETFGDSLNLTLPENGIKIIENVCTYVKCVVVLITGRPVVIEPYLSEIDALVAAWLPGTEGQGVADVLFGDYDFTGKLARTWFKTVDQLPMNVGDKHYDPLFPFGFGLTTKKGK
ncbi:glycosyl hydrolase family protein [Striga asiatica]|uniref:Glycosyl hydrolase family protein n=1 Tax=Striga asiatica TaxID=4170 RepID=A0A5A7Q964_STRAF|nr:glycosyl hydrolase family protein [Striga asiatica]